MLEAHVEIEPSPVAPWIENRDVRSPEPVVLHVQYGLGHRVGHLREIDRGFRSRDADFAFEFGFAALPLQREIGRGHALGRGDDARENRVQQRHVETVDIQPGEIAVAVGGVETADKRVASDAVGDRHPGAAAGEIPARGETHRRRGNVVDLHAVEQDVGRDLAAAQHRLHRRRTVRAALDVVAHALGDLREGRQVEIAQRERHRILAAARGDAVEQQLLLAVHHEKLVDHDLRGVQQDFVGVNLPGLAASGDV